MRLSIRQYALALLDIEKGMGADEAGEAGKRFASWLSRRGENQKLSKIVAEARRIARDRDGIVDVTITTAHTADAATREMLISQAEKVFAGKKIETDFREDSDLIGGAKMRSDEVLYDASLASVVRLLKQAISR